MGKHVKNPIERLIAIEVRSIFGRPNKSHNRALIRQLVGTVVWNNNATFDTIAIGISLKTQMIDKIILIPKKKHLTFILSI